tara:strand:+ start:50 stop:157 length:108 start_codon:yes stop_codon:yes gene_type:complete
LGLFIINISRGAKKYVLHVAEESQKEMWSAGIAVQ